jgi:hypothetical protein
VVLAGTLALAAGASVWLTAGHPGWCPSRQYAAFSLASSTRGQPTPLAAAKQLATGARLPNFPLPITGWHVVSRTSDGAIVQSGGVQARAVEGRNGTWQVDQLSKCN